MIQDANDVCLTDPEEIKLEAVNYFDDFLQSPYDQEEVDGTDDLSELLEYKITEETGNELIRVVTAEEIKKTLHAMPLEKTPGPDEYMKEFVVAAWEVIGSDFVVAVQSFFQFGFMSHGVNATVLALIPKKIDAQK